MCWVQTGPSCGSPRSRRGIPGLKALFGALGTRRKPRGSPDPAQSARKDYVFHHSRISLWAPASHIWSHYVISDER